MPLASRASAPALTRRTATRPRQLRERAWANRYANQSICQSNSCLSMDGPADGRKTWPRQCTLGRRLSLTRSLARAALRSHRRGQREPGVVSDRADLEVEAVRRRRMITLIRRDVDLVAGGRVDERPESALLERRLDRIGIPRLNAE